MPAVRPARAKRTNEGHFCRAKVFIRNNNAGARLTASWSAIEQEAKEKNVHDPEVCSGFSIRGLRVVELNVLAQALDGGCEAYGTALRLCNCINETVSGLGSLLYICCSTPSVERRIFVEQIRPTVAPEPRVRNQSVM